MKTIEREIFIMKKLFLILACVLCSGCINAEVDSNVDIKAEVESLVKAELTGVKAEIKTEIKTEIRTEVKAKMNILGGDVQGRIDELNAKFDTSIETHTQNLGMFSGGGIYVTAVAIALIAGVFLTFIWLIKKIMQWKQVWQIASQTIAKMIDKEMAVEGSEVLKTEFTQRIKDAGLSSVIKSKKDL